MFKALGSHNVNIHLKDDVGDANHFTTSVTFIRDIKNFTTKVTFINQNQTKKKQILENFIKEEMKSIIYVN